MKVNDVVKIKNIAPSAPDHKARVVRIEGDYVFVSNMNMPFMGNFAGEKFHKDEVE